MTTDIKAWVDEHRAIHAAATPEAWTTIQRDGEGPAVVAVPDADGYSPWQAYVGMCSGYDDENATAIVDAHNITVPTALSMIEAVLELHSELTIHELDDVNGTWKYDEDDERVVLARICRGCSSDEAVEHVGDNEWSDTWDDGSVEYPCATRQALEGVIDSE